MPKVAGLGRAEIARRLKLGRELLALTRKIQAEHKNNGLVNRIASDAREEYAEEHYGFGQNVQRDDTMLVAEKFADIPEEILVLLPWEALRVLRYDRTPKEYALKLVRLMAHNRLHLDCPNSIKGTTTNAKLYVAPSQAQLQEVNEKFDALQEELKNSPETELAKLQEIDNNDLQTMMDSWKKEDQEKEQEEITPMTTKLPLDLAPMLERVIKDNVNLEEVTQIVRDIKASSGVDLTPLISAIERINHTATAQADLTISVLEELKASNASLNKQLVQIREDLEAARLRSAQLQDEIDLVKSHESEVVQANSSLLHRLEAERKVNELLDRQLETQRAHLQTLTDVGNATPVMLMLYKQKVEEGIEREKLLQQKIEEGIEREKVLQQKIEELEKEPALSVAEIEKDLRVKIKQEFLQQI